MSGRSGLHPRVAGAVVLALVVSFASLTRAQVPPPPAATVTPAAVPKVPAPPPPAALAPPPFARAHRLALSIAFGLGNASLSSYHSGFIDTYIPQAYRDGFKSNFQISVEIGARYYFPFYIMAHVGYSTLYNWASSGGSDLHNLVMEVPILVGGYYTFFDRLYVYGALGPSVHFYSRSWLDPGRDFKGGSGVGAQFMLGADFMVGENFSVGLDLRYRLLDTGQASELKSNAAQTFDLDFSGISLGLNLRVYAL